jgi:hypothetical protein
MNLTQFNNSHSPNFTIDSDHDIIQPRGSRYPRFENINNSSDPFNSLLFQVIRRTGENALGEPLPRLLVTFLVEFNKAFEVWRGSNIIFWALNRARVVRIARNYIANCGKHWFYRLHLRSAVLSLIILQYECCTADGPCQLCEFNTHSIALLFREERSRIRVYQTLRASPLFGNNVSTNIV